MTTKPAPHGIQAPPCPYPLCPRKRCSNIQQHKCTGLHAQDHHLFEGHLCVQNIGKHLAPPDQSVFVQGASPPSRCAPMSLRLRDQLLAAVAERHRPGLSNLRLVTPNARKQSPFGMDTKIATLRSEGGRVPVASAAYGDNILTWRCKGKLIETMRARNLRIATRPRRTTSIWGGGGG